MLVWVPAQRKRTGAAILLFLIASACLLACAGILTRGWPIDSPAYRWTRFIGLLLFAAAVINVAGVLLFDVLLRAARLRPPAIVSDLLIAVAYIAAAISLLTSVGVNLTDPVPLLPTISLVANDYMHCDRAMDLGKGEVHGLAALLGDIADKNAETEGTNLFNAFWGGIMARIAAHGLESYRQGLKDRFGA